MAQRKEVRQLADAATGEALWMAERERPNYLFRPDSDGRYFMMLGALATEKLEQSGYDGVTLRLLLRFIRTTDSTGLIDKTQKELAALLDTTQPTVSRSMKKLLKDGHLFKRGRSWFLNPETAFHGRSDQHHEAVARVPDDARHLAVVKPLRPLGGDG